MPCFFFLFDCLITSQSTIFQLCQDESSWVDPVLSKDKCVFLKHNTVTPVRLEPGGPSVSSHYAPYNAMYQNR